MKHSTFLFILTLVAVTIVSCKKDFLDVLDNSILTRQNYVKDLNSLDALLNGVYVRINSRFEHGSGIAYPEVAADNLKPLALPPATLLLHYNWAQQKDENYGGIIGDEDLNMNPVWTNAYLLARVCNFVLEEVDRYRGENPVKADDLKGQAYALRALFYFRLVNVFAQPYAFSPDASHPGIPYITTSDISVPFTRQTVKEVYDGLVNDLNNAISLLPASTEDIRFMNRVAAKAMLARTCLFKGDYSTAKKQAAEICTEVPLLSISAGYPGNLFINNAPAETEILFQVTPGDNYYSEFIGTYLRGSMLRYNATQDIVELLQENAHDIRRNWVTHVSGAWNVTKFPVGIAGMRKVLEADYYHPVIRSSEMALTAAEAFAKTGDENEARIYLDAIRKRADPSIAAVTATGQALLDAIYKERRKELAFEGFRMYDLQRWKLGVQRKDALPGSPTGLPYPSNHAIAPIPYQDIKLAGLTQNPGY